MDVSDIKNLDNNKLLDIYSLSYKELKCRNVIKSKNIVKELGEFFVFDFYNKSPWLPYLLHSTSDQYYVNAVSRKGDRYYIKSSYTNNIDSFYRMETMDFTIENDKLFEYLILCKFDDSYEPQAIIEVEWNVFLEERQWNTLTKSWNFLLTRDIIKQCKVIFFKDGLQI